MNYSLLHTGLVCEDREDLGLCYEAAREDFFDEISGDLLLEEGQDEKSDKDDKKQAKEAKKKVKKAKKITKKKIAACALLLTLLAAAVVALKKTAPERANKMHDKVDKLYTEYYELNDKIRSDESGDSSGNKKEMRKLKLIYVKANALAGHLLALCKLWKVPYPGWVEDGDNFDDFEIIDC